MKKIKYRIVTEVNYGTVDQPNVVRTFADKAIVWSKVNEKIAKAEACNGEYTIEDDGEPEPAPTQIDRIEAQVAYTALMTDTLMESEG